jgi:hypothetical protein
MGEIKLGRTKARKEILWITMLKTKINRKGGGK